MPKSQMPRSVLQALAIYVCSQLVVHHLMESFMEEAKSNELFVDFINASGMVDANSVRAQELASLTNSTTGNETAISDTTFQDDDEPFYMRRLPMNILIMLIVLPMDYYWQIWLEKILPGRARPTSISTEEDIATGESSEAQEETLIHRLGAQAKSKRSSLNWRNTFAKWIIDCTLGSFWSKAIMMPAIDGLLHWHSVTRVYSNIQKGWLIRTWGPLVGLHPLYSLIEYISIPAHKRIVFMQGAHSVQIIFTFTVVGTLLRWLPATQMYRDMVGNMTAEALKESQRLASSASMNAQQTEVAHEL